MPKVTFRQPDGTERTGVVPPGTRLLDASFLVGALVRTTCGGLMDCLECRVTIEKGAEHLSRKGVVETEKLGQPADGTCERLACQAKIVGGEVMIRIKSIADQPVKSKVSS